MPETALSPRFTVSIDHDVDLILSISDRIVCMANGKVIANGTPDEVIADEQVQRSYLGIVASEGKVV